MTKTIMMLVIAVAFVTGTLTTASVASAHIDICAQPSADTLKSVWHGICDLQEQIDTIVLTPGTPGPPGADGADLNFYQVTTINNNNNFAKALCDPLDTVVGGGGTGADGFGPDAAGTGPPLPLITSGPTQQGDQEGWIAVVELVAGNTGAHAFAICADTNP